MEMTHTKTALRRELAYWQRGAVGLLALAAAGNTALCALLARQERTIEQLQAQAVEITAPVESPAPVIPLPEEPTEPAQPELESIGLFTVTAYCPCQSCCGKAPGHPDYGVTATGTEAMEGRTIAVDPGVIELGSTVYFEGLDGLVGGYVAEDTGGAIKGNRIDLYVSSHADALDWGVRELEVFKIQD